MARIDIDKIEKIDKSIRPHEFVKATYSVSNIDDYYNAFQIDTYSSEGSHITQSIQFDKDNLCKFLKLVSTIYESFSVPLLDDNGDVKYGLNWGNRTGRNINQAYLDLPKEIYNSNFFPTNGIKFYIRTDDNQNIKFVRAQKDNINGHALQTPDDNTILGIYIRNRLSLNPGEIITKEAILKYGRDHVTISKIGDFYYLDFSAPNKLGKENNSDIEHVASQLIFYGAPGTGKSHIINEITEGESVIRTTFHPDSDYSTFVGAYKPTTKEVTLRDLSGHPVKENGVTLTEDRIIYEFVDQAFLQAYVQAWKYYAEADESSEPQKQYLIIEEINRGNCAQIFGDLFQLLDRNCSGFSDYPINADNDMKKQLAKAFKGISIAQADRINNCYKGKDVTSKVLSGEILLLPNNLYIWATMNTSDQSLFPIDSAFKRRWDWQYMPICKGRDENGNELNWKITADTKEYDWWSFLSKINGHINATTNSEDKKLGFFFCKPQDGCISSETFVGKVIFYLWNDVFKDFGFEDPIFKDIDGSELSFNKFYIIDNKGNVVVNIDKVELFLQNLGVEAIKSNDKFINDSLPEVDEDGNNETTPTKDFSRYSINSSGSYSKGSVVLEAMKIYIANNPQKNADDIKDDWLALGVNVPNFVETQAMFNERKQKSKDSRIDEKAKIASLPNGQTLYVSNQYTPERIADVISKINGANWNINISRI